MKLSKSRSQETRGSPIGWTGKVGIKEVQGNLTVKTEPRKSSAVFCLCRRTERTGIAKVLLVSALTNFQWLTVS
jgi:hypothetical protein